MRKESRCPGQREQLVQRCGCMKWPLTRNCQPPSRILPPAPVCLELLRGNRAGLLSRTDFAPPVVGIPVLVLITSSLASSIKQAPQGFLLEVVN